MFTFHSNYDNRKYGILDVVTTDYKYVDENLKEYSFSHFLSTAFNINQNWKPPLIKRLRSKRALPDYISSNISVPIFSENGYQKLVKILDKGIFLPALVENTDEKIYFYQYPICNFLNIID